MNPVPKSNTRRWLGALVVPLCITLGIMVGGYRDEWGESGFFLRFGIVYLVTCVGYNVIGMMLGKVLKKTAKNSDVVGGMH